MFCSKEDIEYLLQIEFTDTSNPSEDTIEENIERVTSYLKVVFIKNNIPIPTDTDELEILKEICMYRTAGLVGLTFGRNFENVEKGQAYEYLKIAENMLEDYTKKYSSLSAISKNSNFFLTNKSAERKWENNRVKW